MSAPLSLPPKVRWELEHPAPPGARHEQIKRLACALVGQGLPAAHAFALLRPRYGPDVPNREIENLTRWAAQRIPKATRGHSWPAGGQSGHALAFQGLRGGLGRSQGSPPRPPLKASLPPEMAIGKFLNGFEGGEEALFEASPIPLSADWREDAGLFLASLYAPADRVNLVWKYVLEGGKARPVGRGLTLPCAEWLSWFREKGVPHGEGGVWIRMNPLSGNGVSDADVGVFRFALLEADGVSLPLQTGFFSRLPLPIAAIVASGGRSLHAWVRVNAPDAAVYRATVGAIFSRLTPFGIDPSNRNPSRLARLPGVSRNIGGGGDARQRLLYLNPNATNSQPISP